MPRSPATQARTMFAPSDLSHKSAEDTHAHLQGPSVAAVWHQTRGAVRFLCSVWRSGDGVHTETKIQVERKTTGKERMGQRQVCKHLDIFCLSAKMRGVKNALCVVSCVNKPGHIMSGTAVLLTDQPRKVSEPLFCSLKSCFPALTGQHSGCPVQQTNCRTPKLPFAKI